MSNEVDGAAAAEAEPKRFEDIVETLEQLVRRLESGELALDEALQLYERGVNLARRGHDLLEGAERRVETLQRSLSEGGAR